jgi:surfeit locus 1 family protein
MNTFMRMFSRRWFMTTLLVIAGMAVLARLGVWQLDRLEQRRAFNARVLAQIDQPPLDLNTDGLKADLGNMEYRQVVVTGEYDPSQEIAIRNQYWGNEWGVHLVTPLKIAGTEQAILVDRGWIPAADFESNDWSRFAEPGTVTVSGVVRASRDRADFGFRRDPEPSPGETLRAWNFVNVPSISKQITLSLLPVYIQQAPDPTWTGMPYRTQPELELSEGPHLGYAIQWFTFAALLGLGYPFFVRRQERHSTSPGSGQMEKASLRADNRQTLTH